MTCMLHTFMATSTQEARFYLPAEMGWEPSARVAYPADLYWNCQSLAVLENAIRAVP